MADNSVRLARVRDTPAIAAIQSKAWRVSYAGVLPTEVIDALDEAATAASWREAIVSPPSARHRILVAFSGPDAVGFSAFGPGTDPDLEATQDAEILAFIVAPEATGTGHGSRLLAATVDFLRDADFRTAHIWLSAADAALTEFLDSAGWAADGATRELDLYGDQQTLVRQTRLHTDIREE